MAYKDGEVFRTYCDKPYNQNKYKMVFKNGKAIIYDGYDVMSAWWYKYCGSDALSHVEIISKVKKGF